MTDGAAKKKAGLRKPQVRYYRFRNALKEKASGGLGDGGPGAISADALQAAEAEFVKMSEDYPDWVQSHLATLYDMHQRCLDTPEQRHFVFNELRDAAHDLKGQGGTFGYTLISHFGESLFNFAHTRTEYSDNHVELVKAHIDAMNAVIKGRIKGNGGELGKELMESLQQAFERYADAAD